MSDAPWNKCPFCPRPFFCFIFYLFFIISFVIYHLFDSIWFSVSPSYYAALVHVVYVFRRFYYTIIGSFVLGCQILWSGWTGSFPYFLAIDLFYHLCCRAVVVYAEREKSRRHGWLFYFFIFRLFRDWPSYWSENSTCHVFPSLSPLLASSSNLKPPPISYASYRRLSFPISYRFD